MLPCNEGGNRKRIKCLNKVAKDQADEISSLKEEVKKLKKQIKAIKNVLDKKSDKSDLTSIKKRLKGKIGPGSVVRLQNTQAGFCLRMDTDDRRNVNGGDCNDGVADLRWKIIKP
jgi:hypothetical protein